MVGNKLHEKIFVTAVYRVTTQSNVILVESEIWIKSSLLHNTLSTTRENRVILMRRLIKLNSKIDSGHNWSEYFSLDTLSKLDTDIGFDFYP